MDAELIQKTYIRICRDSQFKFDYIRAAVFTGNLLKISPLEVWIALSSLEVMERIANGTHPCLQLEKYK